MFSKMNKVFEKKQVITDENFEKIINDKIAKLRTECSHEANPLLNVEKSQFLNKLLNALQSKTGLTLTLLNKYLTENPRANKGILSTETKDIVNFLKPKLEEGQTLTLKGGQLNNIGLRFERINFNS
jgi:hypothetical protein